MSRLDFSGLRDELILENLPTRAHPEGRTYIVRDPAAEDIERLLEIQDQSRAATEELLKISGDTELADDVRDKQIGAAKAKLDSADAAIHEFLTVDGKEVSLLRRLLGTSLDQIEADGLSATSRGLLEQSIVTAALQGLDIAQTEITRMAAGEALARGNRATRRAAAKKSSDSSRPAGSKSSQARTSASTARASSGTRARTAAKASTSRSSTSGTKPARKAV